VIEGPVLNAYRGVMSAAASVASLATRLPVAPERWRELGDRLGRLAPTDRAVATAGTVVWLHAASVGELVAVRPLLRRLRERFPERLYVVSTATRTGLALARTIPEAHLAILLPLDAPGPVRRLLAHLRLEAFLFTETEVWPTLLAELGHARVPTFMVSGRVSARTAGRARWLRPLYRRALAGVTCCMQSEEDAQRIIALGADPRRVQVAGSLKFDRDHSDPPDDVVRLGRALGGRRAIVAGSTHPGEDEAVLDAYRRVASGRPDVVLLLAPRHPDRMRGVVTAIENAGFRCVRFSMLGEQALESPCVVLLDVIGTLAHCYTLGTAAFVGGSLVPVGGHNVLEPASAARPVVVGPHTDNAAEVVERLVAGGGAIRVSSAESLAWALAGLLDAPERAADMGRRARALVESGQGAVERHLKIIAARLTQTRFARTADDTPPGVDDGDFL
jgi:3-deoxy-D-manno-octulosonic-acid transferase